MINGDYTCDESNAVFDIITEMKYYADDLKLEIDDVKDDTDTTDLNWDSYVGIDDEDDEGETSDDSDDDTISIPIHFTVSINDDDLSKVVQISDVGDNQPSVIENTPVKDETIDSLLAELDGLVGLSNVKRDVHSLMNFIKVAKIREKRGMKVPTISYHLVFIGNPGTGKTTVARLVAKLYYHMGILPKGQLVETDRSSLVAGYLGQTAIKTQKVIQQAMN